MKQQLEKIYTLLESKKAMWILCGICAALSALLIVSGISSAGGPFAFAAAFAIISNLSHKEFLFRWSPIRAAYRSADQLDQYRRLMVTVTLVFILVGTLRFLRDVLGMVLRLIL